MWLFMGIGKSGTCSGCTCSQTLSTRFCGEFCFLFFLPESFLGNSDRLQRICKAPEIVCKKVFLPGGEGWKLFLGVCGQ
jgi:hypothetical protein